MSNNIQLLSSIIVLSIKHKKNTQDNIKELNVTHNNASFFSQSSQSHPKYIYVIYHKEKHDILILEKLEVLAFCLKNN